MSPLSAPVLGAAAVVSSPAIWSAVDGTLPVDVALTRSLIAVGICWALISLVAEFAFPQPGTVAPERPNVEPVERAETEDDTAA